MGEMVKARTLCEKPRSGVFAGEGKYLRLQKFTIKESMHPIIEEDSVFVFVKGGHGKFTINGVEFDVSAGSFCWLQSYHVLTIESDWTQPLELWVCVYDYQLVSYLTFSEQAPEVVDAVVSAAPVIQLKGENLEKVEHLFFEYDALSHRNDVGGALIKVAILGQLSSIVVKEGIKKAREDRRIRRPLGWNASLYIAAHCTEPLKAETVASYFKSDAVTLNRELRIVSGMNFAQMLNRNRVNMATNAILFDGLSFSFIAAYSGFHSEIAFYRSFKKQKGYTPQEYRERTLNKGPGLYRGMIVNETLLSALGYMYENFPEQINLKSMAQDLYTSESIIRNLLKDTFDLGYKDILTMFRVRYAESLLTSTDLPILDVSVASGFNSDRTFTRLFYEMNSLTPSEFRRNSGRKGENNGQR